MRSIYYKKICIITAIVFMLIILSFGYWRYNIYMNGVVKIDLHEMEQVTTKKELPGTWWTTIFSEDHSITKKYDIELPKVDFTNYNLIISAGREIKSLTYSRKSRVYLPYKEHPYVGEAIFKKQLYPNTFFVYKIKKINVVYDDINWPEVKIEN